jgi:hypothetical protein
MTRLRRLVLPVLLVLATIGGVAAAPSGATTIPTYHQAASGTTVRLKVGAELRVSLQAAGGTAYRWVVTAGHDVVPFQIVSRRSYVVTPGLPGGPVRTVWTIRGRHVGYATFRTVLRSVVDGTVARRFVLHIRVVA